MNNLNSSVNISWHYQLSAALAELDIEGHFFLCDDFNLFVLEGNQLAIHLVNLENQFSPAQLLIFQQEQMLKGIKIVHLWEDVWISRSNQVLARISSLSGRNKRIHGRKTNIQKIDKIIAQQFLNENHLQGYVNSRYKFGLFENNDLVAVATFSALRRMDCEANYKSAELIRFAVKSGFSVSGGLSKLITHFFILHKPNDIMTYSDRDWSAGEAYQKLKFIEKDVLEPQYFCLDASLKRSLIKDIKASIFNTGSVKYILKS